jgi:hypothetical protein
MLDGTGRIRKLAALALVALGAGLGASSAHAAAPGVVADLTWYIPDSDKQRTAAALEEMGSEWVRLHVQWREAEPQRGVLNEWWMNEYGKAIDVARDAGQKVIVMVSEAPSWSSGSAAHNVPRDPADYASFMRRFAERFAGRVDAYEIWNEPNIKRFWSTGPDAAEYTQLLRAAHAAVRAADPEARVVFGGLSTNDYGFLNRAYAAGAKGYFDALATHPYPYCGSTGPEEVRRSGGRITADSFLGYRELRALMVERGDAKPIWITEFGWNTSTVQCNPGSGQWQGGVSEAKQAEYLTRAYELLEQDSYVEVAIWYALRNNYWANDANEPEARYGLLRTDYSPKPAFEAFADYAKGENERPDDGEPGESGEPSPGSKPPKAVRTAVKLDVKPARKAAKVRGRVVNADRGAVRLIVQRKQGRRWQHTLTAASKVDRRGRYERRLRLGKGAFRIAARFPGTGELEPSRSPFKRLRTG